MTRFRRELLKLYMAMGAVLGGAFMWGASALGQEWVVAASLVAIAAYRWRQTDRAHQSGAEEKADG